MARSTDDGVLVAKARDVPVMVEVRPVNTASSELLETASGWMVAVLSAVTKLVLKLDVSTMILVLLGVKSLTVMVLEPMENDAEVCWRVLACITLAAFLQRFCAPWPLMKAAMILLPSLC